MSEKKVKIIIIISLAVLFFGIILGALIFSKEENDISDEDHETITDYYKYSEIYDIEEYQMAYSCLEKYFNQINESGNIMQLLHSNYINKNNITINNIYGFIENKYDLFNYKIYQIEKYYNSYFTIFYVKGIYAHDTVDEGFIEQKDVKELVIIDIVNNTFAIVPLLNENDNFQEIINKYNLKDYDEYIKLNSSNEISFNSIDDVGEAMLYFNDYISLLTSNCTKAYNYIGETTKNEYSNLSDFKNICDLYINQFSNPIIKNYRFYNSNQENKLIITDYYENEYEFTINSVMNYKVDIKIK